MPITPEDRLTRNIADLEKRIAEIQEDLKEINNESIDGLEKELKKRQLILEKIEEEIKLKRLNNEDTKELRDKEELIKRLIENQNELLEEQRKIFEDIKDLPKSFADDLSRSLGIITDINSDNKGFGLTYKMLFKTGNVFKAINASAEKLSKDLIPRIGFSMLEKAQELFVAGFHQLDEVGASLARNIPEGRKYQAMVSDIARTSGTAYLNFEDAGMALEGITKNFASFNKIGDESLAKLTKSGAMFEKLGVDADTFGENLRITNKTFGMSSDEFIKFEEGMFGASKSLGISIGTLNKNFAQMSKRLADFRKENATKIFYDMALASKNTGIEMNRLLDITEQFTTFEGAAEAAGKLNSILGTMINPLDLMNAALEDPVEVFSMFKKQIDQTGKSFNTFTPAMKRALSEATNLSTEELNNLMGKPLKEGREQMLKDIQTKQDMAKAAAAATPVIQKLLRLWYSFAEAISPVVDEAQKLVDWTAKFIQQHPETVKWIGRITLGFLGLAVATKVVLGTLTGILALGKTAKGVGGLFGLFGGGKGGIAGYGGKLGGLLTGGLGGGGPLEKFGQSAARLGAELLPIAAAIALIGAGIGAAAWAFGYMADKFKAFIADLDIKKVAKLDFAIHSLALSLYNLGLSLATVAATGLVAIPVLMAIDKLQNTNKETPAQVASKEETKNIELTVNVYIDSPVVLDGKKVGQFVSETINKQNIKLIPGKLYVATDIKTG